MPGRIPPALVRQMPGGAELWEYGGKIFLAGRSKESNGYLLAGRNVPDDFQERMKEIAVQTAAYEQQRQHLRTYKNQMLATLLLFTILLMFAATWICVLSLQAGYRAHSGAGRGNAGNHRGQFRDARERAGYRTNWRRWSVPSTA